MEPVPGIAAHRGGRRHRVSMTDIATLANAIARFRTMAAEAGRDPNPLDMCFTPFSHPGHKDIVDPAAFVAEAHELADIGVTWLAFHLPRPSIGEFCERSRRSPTRHSPKVRA